MAALPINFYGWPDEAVPDYSVRMYSGIGMLLVCLLIYSRIFAKSINASKKIDNKKGKVGLQMIAYSQLPCFTYLLGYLPHVF